MQEFHQTTASFVWKSYVDQARRMALANWAIASLSFYSRTAANFLFSCQKKGQVQNENNVREREILMETRAYIFIICQKDW